MSKFVWLLPVVLAACVLAGSYGALHDQLSYTISPEYFTQFKFHQFKIPPAWQNRWGVAWVGWQASWWMGAWIGIPLGLLALIMPDRRRYLLHAALSFVVVLATTLLVGIGGLLASWNYVTAENQAQYYVPPGVTDPVAFHRVGTLHEYSYLGGFVGIAAGALYLIAVWLWQARRQRVAKRATDMQAGSGRA